MKTMEERKSPASITFAELITQAMDEQGLTTSTLARLTGVSADKLQGYLRFQSPSLYFCRKLAVVLHIPLERIVHSLDPAMEEEQLRILLENYRALSEDERRIVDNLLWVLRQSPGIRR